MIPSDQLPLELDTSQMIGEIAGSLGIKLDKNDPAFVLVELNKMALRPLIERLEKLSRQPSATEELAILKAQLADAVGRGNERILAAILNISPSDPRDDLREGQTQTSEQLDVLKMVHEQWSTDAQEIGQKMDAAMTAAVDILKQIATLQARAHASVVAPPSSAPVGLSGFNQKPTVIYKASTTTILLVAGISVLITLFAAYGLYRFSSGYKAEVLGTALSERWGEFDKDTQNKIKTILKLR